MVTSLGHVGIYCDDFMKMRDFYTRVIGLTVTDESEERGYCFLSADPENEHHELALFTAKGSQGSTQNIQQISYIVKDLAALREFDRRFKAEGTEIVRTVTHGIALSIYFNDPEGNYSEVYFKTGFNVKQGMGESIDLDTQSDEELIAFSKSFEELKGPSLGAEMPVGTYE